MSDLAAALASNPLIPTPHWEPRCELCRLRRTAPEVYSWLTQQLLGLGSADDPVLTQEEIAAEVARRTSLGIDPSQVSRHKTRHLDPSLADAVESMTGHLVLLDHLAGMDPAQMAVAYTKLALAKTGSLLAEAEGAKSAAPLAAGVAALARVLQSADRDDADTELARIEVALAQMRQQTATGDYQTQFADWVRDNYPDLAPVLANPAALKALLASAQQPAPPAGDKP